MTYFFSLTDNISKLINGDEFAHFYLEGEVSDFIRFNENRIRQNGNVDQFYCTFTLISNNRQASSVISLSNNLETDIRLFKNALETLRKTLPNLEEDPYILYSTEINSSYTTEENELPDTLSMVDEIIAKGNRKDLVGILSTGKMIRAFANSLGQKNWFEKAGFSFDWSIYFEKDKAVKSGYAGFKWKNCELAEKMDGASKELSIMKKDAVTIKPGSYRVYLAPAAVDDFMHTMSWGGFGIKSQKTGNSSLLKLVEEEKSFNEKITLTENNIDGSSPLFSNTGFIKPDKITLVENGKHKNSLASPRSAKEYGVAQNGSNSWEMPESLELSSGGVGQDSILETLDNGIYLNNVHYLNYSDRSNCSMTGMSRFACFEVKNGKIVAPINVMRFDVSLYDMLGENFVGATKKRERSLSTNTYGQRHTESTYLPGIIVDNFKFTL